MTLTLSLALLALAVVSAVVLRYASRIAQQMLDLTRLGQDTTTKLAEDRKVELAAERAITKALREELERARTDLADAKEQSHKQFTLIQEMRRDGFSLPSDMALAPPTPNELQERDPLVGTIRDAIIARARNRTETAQLERFARERLLEDMDAAKIAAQILRGADLNQIA